MSLYAIADLHLSLGTDKPMDIFGGWKDHVNKLKENWIKLVKSDDTVVLPGDLSWGMSLEESLEDFRFVDSLPGTKIILKGNHDYWWTTVSKSEKFFQKNCLTTLKLLNNNHYVYKQYGICGTRGWINETSEPADKKVLLREAGRLETSITSAEKQGLIPIVFLHYPPVYGSSYNLEIMDVLVRHKIKDCYYGHIHGKGSNYAINGERDGIKYRLISCDYVQFEPQLVVE